MHVCPVILCVLISLGVAIWGLVTFTSMGVVISTYFALCIVTGCLYGIMVVHLCKVMKTRPSCTSQC